MVGACVMCGWACVMYGWWHRGGAVLEEAFACLYLLVYISMYVEYACGRGRDTGPTNL